MTELFKKSLLHGMFYGSFVASFICAMNACEGMTLACFVLAFVTYYFATK